MANDLSQIPTPPGTFQETRAWLMSLVNEILGLDRQRVIARTTEPSSADLTALWQNTPVPPEAMVIWFNSSSGKRVSYAWDDVNQQWLGMAEYPIAQALPTGIIMPFTGSEGATVALLPEWVTCNGQAISRSTYASLFTVVGTTYGSGDGVNTFNVPDLRGRIIAMKDSFGGVSANRVVDAQADIRGGTMGEEKHQLTTPEIPAHGHTMRVAGTGAVNGYWLQAGTYAAYANHASTVFGNLITDTGGGGTHNNMQPTMFLHYIIKS